jgi:hypothetical protein
MFLWIAWMFLCVCLSVCVFECVCVCVCVCVCITLKVLDQNKETFCKQYQIHLLI